jgi:ABC-2 type transport system ATP-binding protein
MPAIVVEDLRKHYGDLVAVDGVSFTVEEGEVLALLGPNGAGKTTTVEILEGHRERTSGSVSVLGFDPATGGRAYRERIGIVLQEAGFEDQFTVTELCTLYRSMYPRRRDVGEVIELAGLVEKRDARVGTLSGGQRRRLDLALGLVGDPDLIFLDEPTTGFDPSARRSAWEVVDGLRSLGKTILLTTHYMDEAQHLADRVAAIVGGRLVALDTPAALAANAGLGSVIRFAVPNGYADNLPVIGQRCTIVGTQAQISTADPLTDIHALTSWALAQGVALDGLAVDRPTLDDVYLLLAGDTGSSASATIEAVGL